MLSIQVKAVGDKIILTREKQAFDSETEKWTLSVEEARSLLTNNSLRDAVITAANNGRQERRHQIELLERRIRELKALDELPPNDSAPAVRIGK